MENLKLTADMSLYSRRLEEDIHSLHHKSQNSHYKESYALIEELYPAVVDGYFFFERKNFILENTYGSLLLSVSLVVLKMAENEELDRGLKEKLFSLLIKNLYNRIRYKNSIKMYESYDACQKLAIQLGKEDLLLNYLDQRLCFNNGREDNFFSISRFQLLYHEGRILEAMAFLEAKKHQDKYFECDVAEFFLKDNNLSMAREMIVPNYELTFQNENNLSRIIREAWQNLMVMLCYTENNMVLLKKCLNDIVMQEGNYIRAFMPGELKRLSSDEEWESYYPKIKALVEAQDLARSSRDFPISLAYFYAEVGEYENLMTIIRQYDASEIEQFFRYLLPVYKEEVISMYIPYFKNKINEKNLDFILSEMTHILFKIPSAISPFNGILYPFGQSFILEGDSLRNERF